MLAAARLLTALCQKQAFRRASSESSAAVKAQTGCASAQTGHVWCFNWDTALKCSRCVPNKPSRMLGEPLHKLFTLLKWDSANRSCRLASRQGPVQVKTQLSIAWAIRCRQLRTV